MRSYAYCCEAAKIAVAIKYSMQTPEQKQFTEAILAELKAANPYTQSDGRTGYIWAAGFLAAYLASLATEDPYIYKRFRAHIRERAKKPRP